jgi:hypothetical protein
MNAPITLEQLNMLNNALLSTRPERKSSNPVPERTLLSALAVRHSVPETPEEIAKVNSALAYLTTDVGRGSGTFYDSTGKPISDYWLAVVWAITSLEWSSGKAIAQEWSKGCPARYTDVGFEVAWNSFDPTHPNPVGIGSLYKRVKELGWQEPKRNSTVQGSKKYTLLTPKQLELLPPLEWAIKHIFPRQGIVAIYGPSQSGKSFLAMDGGIAIAEGKRWFARRVSISSVVYVALEGEGGYRNRVMAWQEVNHRKISDNFKFMIKQTFHLDSTEDVEALASVVNSGSVIIIDTLNRAAPTADENNSEDMGRILEGAKRLQALTEGLIIIVHHTGKDASRGARGHSSFFAALDAAIEVKRDGQTNQRSWSLAKAKDSEDGAIYHFDLVPVPLGQDSDLEPVTSCVLRWNPNVTTIRKQPRGKDQKTVLKFVQQALQITTARGRGGSPAQTPCTRASEVIEAVAALIDERPSRARRLTRARLDSLIKAGHICQGDELGEFWIWLPKE